MKMSKPKTPKVSEIKKDIEGLLAEISKEAEDGFTLSQFIGMAADRDVDIPYGRASKFLHDQLAAGKLAPCMVRILDPWGQSRLYRGYRPA